MKKIIDQAPLVNLEYIYICDNIYLKKLETLKGEVLLAIACKVGKARLIDNMVISVD